MATPKAAAGKRAAQQWFQFGPWAFDVTGAERLLRRHPRPAIDMPVADWVRAYGPLIGVGNANTGITGGAPVDREYAMTKSDLTRPLLLITLPASDSRALPPAFAAALPRADDGGLLVLADGKHRLWKAHTISTARLPAYVLTQAETARIRGNADHAPDTWRPSQKAHGSDRQIITVRLGPRGWTVVDQQAAPTDRERAREQLREIGAICREYNCPQCGAERGEPCPSCPDHAHFDRILTAARILGRPVWFDRLTDYIHAAYPLPSAPAAETTKDGRTVLWRAAPAKHPWHKRGAYWTHSREWAEAYAVTFAIKRVAYSRFGVWRTEARISDRTACEIPAGDPVRPHELDALLRDDPAWPGSRWLLYRDTDPNNSRPSRYKQLLNYIFTGKGAVKAALITGGEEVN